MDDIYVYDQNLEQIGVVDAYKSCIWAKRYIERGDCELYVEATLANMNLLQKNYYLAREDDDMVCQIKKIELDTDVENGNYLIISGVDVKSLLDQRVIWGTMTVNGNLETFIRSMVHDAVCYPNLSARQMQKANGQQLIYLGTAAGFTDVMSEQVSYKNVGEKIREYCQKYEWGYRIVLSDGNFYFQLYKGQDKSNSVVFSENYDNLEMSKYVIDETNLGNVALVAGEGEGTTRSRNVSGYAEGLERYEIYVDAKDISKTITWGDLTDLYPTIDSGGQGYISGNATSGYTYKMNYLNVQIVDSDQLTQLEANYPDGQEVTIGGIFYYQVYNAVVADLPSNNLADGDNVVLRDIVYSVYLLNRGYEKLAEYGAITSFEGTIEPGTTFIYKQDYNLGDIVCIENNYGISVNARITEIIEVNDDTGNSVQPKFEYMTEV